MITGCANECVSWVQLHQPPRHNGYVQKRYWREGRKRKEPKQKNHVKNAQNRIKPALNSILNKKGETVALSFLLSIMTQPTSSIPSFICSSRLSFDSSLSNHHYVSSRVPHPGGMAWTPLVQQLDVLGAMNSANVSFPQLPMDHW